MLPEASYLSVTVCDTQATLPVMVQKWKWNYILVTESTESNIKCWWPEFLNILIHVRDRTESTLLPATQCGVTVNPERMNISDNTAVLYVPCCPLMLLLFQKTKPWALVQYQTIFNQQRFFKTISFFSNEINQQSCYQWLSIIKHIKWCSYPERC
jgi:hypothetical protein